MESHTVNGHMTWKYIVTELNMKFSGFVKNIIKIHEQIFTDLLPMRTIYFEQNERSPNYCQLTIALLHDCNIYLRSNNNGSNPPESSAI